MRRSAFLKALAIGAGAFGCACVLTAPRPMDEGRRGEWDYLRRFRYAHRGLYDPSLGISENSLAAFERAARMGFGSELDVHLAADGSLVVVHDSNLARMTGQDVVVEDLALDEIRSLRLGGTDAGIPLLSEVLETYERLGANLPLIVEIKTYGDDVDRLTAATMAELDRHRIRYCVESFDPRVVLWLRRNRPDVFRGQLSQNFLASDQRSGKGAAFDLLATTLACNAAARPDFVAYRYGDSQQAPAMLATRVLGAAYVGWTLHSVDELLACEGRGGIGIFEGFVPDTRSSAYSND